MKECKKCHLFKQIEDFYKTRAICKACVLEDYKRWAKNPIVRAKLNEKQRNWRRENLEHIREYERRRSRKRINKLLETLNLKNLACSFCGYSKCKSALEFHHKNLKDKDFGIGEAISRRMSAEEIIREMEKCVVLCSNCHRELHAKP